MPHSITGMATKTKGDRMSVRYVSPAPPVPTINKSTQTAQAVVLERTYRQLPASAARILENFWVAIGCAGFVLALFMLAWLWQERHTMTEQQQALRLIGIVFLIVNGVYALVRFGLDEWIDLAHSLAQDAEIRDLLAELDEAQADNAALRTELHQAQLNLDALRRRREPPATPTSTAPAPQPEQRLIVCVRILLQRWMHNVSYSRETMTEKLLDRPQTMTESEWRQAMEALTRAGLTGMGGPGNRQRVIVGDPNNTEAMVQRVKEVL